MKQHNKVSLGEAIDTFIKENKLKPQLDAMRVKSLWEKLMGKTIVKHTTSVHLKAGKLYLNFGTPALKNEMYYSREKIKELLNTELGEEVINEVLIY